MSRNKNFYSISEKNQELQLLVCHPFKGDGGLLCEAITLRGPDRALTESLLAEGFEVIGCLEGGRLTIGRFSSNGELEWKLSFAYAQGDRAFGSGDQTPFELARRRHKEFFLEKKPYVEFRLG